MHIGLRKLDYTCFLKFFNGLYNAYIIRFFQKNGYGGLKMPYERKKVETFTIDARNRITSRLQNLCQYVSNRDWNGICTKIVEVVEYD